MLTRWSRLNLLGATAVSLLCGACDYFPAGLLEIDAGTDAALDGIVEGGQPVDAPRQDGDGPTKPDGPPPDGPTKPDGPPPDGPASTDAPVTPPCATPATKGQTYAADMVVCEVVAGGTGISQCAAPPLCNAAGGWSLCSASQFLARGGQSTATVNRAWLKACIRDNGTPASPVDALCSSCAGAALAAETVGWRCTGNKSDTTSNAYVGVASFFDCRRVGVNATSAEAYWHPAVAVSAAVAAAVCCH